MGCNIPRPWKRPQTPPIYESPKMPKTAPAKNNDHPYGSKTNEAVLKAFDQFHAVAHGYLTPPKSVRIDTCVSNPKQITRTNCPNCCATITGPICEYCGTRFPELQQHYLIKTTENQEIVIPIYIGNEKIDEVKTIKIPTKEEF